MSHIEEAEAVIHDIDSNHLSIYDDQPAVLWGILNALIGIHEKLENGLLVEVVKK
jgi:hypothetical protein